jgi:hypothetical protein
MSLVARALYIGQAFCGHLFRAYMNCMTAPILLSVVSFIGCRRLPFMENRWVAMLASGAAHTDMSTQWHFAQGMSHFCLVPACLLNFEHHRHLLDSRTDETGSTSPLRVFPTEVLSLIWHLEWTIRCGKEQLDEAEVKASYASPLTCKACAVYERLNTSARCGNSQWWQGLCNH